MVSRKKSIKTFFDNEESSQKAKHKISKSCKENLNYVKILHVIWIRKYQILKPQTRYVII